MGANRPERVPNSFWVEARRAAHKRKVVVIFEQEVFGLALVHRRASHPIRDGAVDNRQPELLVHAALTRDHQAAQDSLLASPLPYTLIFAARIVRLNGSAGLSWQVLRFSTGGLGARDRAVEDSDTVLAARR